MKKIILITGANKGIGFETAKQLGALGHYIIVGARDSSRGRDAVQSLSKQGVEAEFLQIDPTNSASVGSAVAEVQAKHGALDVLVNNAGVFLQGDGADPEAVSTDIFRQTYEVNVFGLHEVTKGFWGLLNKSKAARLVNVSSALGSLTMHSNGALGDLKVLAYDSSKAAVNMMTTHYAYKWKGTPHKANCIHPGSVKTDMNPQGELSLEVGAKTSVELATTGANGPNGKFFHLGEELPW